MEKIEAPAPVLASGETVTVGCKLPNGLNLGHLHGAGKPIVILNGANHPSAVAGCGLTHGIDKGAMEQWLKDHGGENGIPAIRKGHIFMFEKVGSAVEMAKEIADQTTGLEGLDPDAPGDGIEPEPDQKKRTETAKAAKAAKSGQAEAAHRGR